jgi:hypothetical protein
MYKIQRNGREDTGRTSEDPKVGKDISRSSIYWHSNLGLRERQMDRHIDKIANSVQEENGALCE